MRYYFDYKGGVGEKYLQIQKKKDRRLTTQKYNNTAKQNKKNPETWYKHTQKQQQQTSRAS